MQDAAVANEGYTAESVTGWVVPRSASGAVPLYHAYNPTSKLNYYSTSSSGTPSGFSSQGIATYVFPSDTPTWNPQPFRTYEHMPQLSQDLWYVIVNRANNDDYGLMMTGHKSVEFRQVPKTGDYSAFQWQVVPNTNTEGTYRILNRKYPSLALDCSLTVGPTVGNKSGATGQRWILTPFKNGGTDTYSLSNSYIKAAKSIAYSGGRFSTQATGATDQSQAFTFVAMELNGGYFIPGLEGSSQAFPYNKQLEITQGVKILGTGTTTEWAMLRAWVIYQNMTDNVQSQYSRANLPGKDVIIISKDDTNAKTAHYPIIMPRQSEAQVASTRGGCMVDIGPNDYTYITEEMMCQTGVVNRPSDNAYRRWDQLTHEYGHLLDFQMGLNGQGTPSCCLGLTTECFAASVSAWYDTNLTYPCLNAQTRSQLQSNQPALYNYIKDRFDVASFWQPPAQLRKRY